MNKCNTIKLLETPKVKQYSLSQRKCDEEGSVVASLILPLNILKNDKKVGKNEYFERG